MRLKHFMLAAILTALALGLSAGSVGAAERIVRVGVYENEPKIFTAPDGQPAGIFIDTIEAIAKHEGWKLKYVSGTWTQGLERLERGQIDLMPDVAYSSEREKIYSFHTVPVLSSWSQVYARKGSGIQSILDLQAKRVAVLEHSVQQETFNRLAASFGLRITFVSAPDFDTMFAMVAKGQADAALTNRFYGLKHARKFGLEDTPVIFDPAPLFFAAPKFAPRQILDAIDSRLSDLKRDPQSAYYASLNRWTAEEVKFQLPAWLKLFGLGLGLALVMSLAGGFILKHQVNVRTMELQSARQRFMDIVEFLPDATFVVDQEKRVLAWNKACENLTGVKQEALLGQTDYAYAEPFFGERRPVLLDLLDLPMPELEAGYKYFQRKDDRIYAETFVPRLRAGQGAYLWAVAAPLYDQAGHRCGAIETIRDVTEQKRIEEALRVSEREYRELVMLANSIILRWTPDGRIAFLNEFGQRFFGYSLSEIVGRHVLGTIVPTAGTTDRDLRQMINDICSDPQKFERNINQNMRRDGELVWIDWTNKVVLDAQGQTKEILSIGSDISERKQAEERVGQLNAELKLHAAVLEQRVAERTAELEVAKERAEAADRIKSAFLASMSHELRTPLNSIIGFTGILLQGLAGELNEEQNKQLGMVQSSSRHLLSLINDVLDISKIEAGQLEIALATFELRPSIEKMVKLVSPLALQKGIGLELEIAPAVGLIASDQRRLEQIVLNLLSNAVKFTESGAVRVTCRVENDQYLLTVVDTGIGMRAEDLDDIFEPFHQLDAGLARKHEGTGLGLSICKKLLDMLGGSISVISQPGQGSTFTVRLPAQGGIA